MNIFIAIADEGSLSAAARRLGKSLPGVSRSLAQLETHLGVRLFNRTTRRVALTEVGLEYLRHCKQLLADLEQGEAALAKSRVQARGHLVLSAPLLFGRLHVAPLIPRFLALHSEVSVELRLVDRMVNLIDERVDVAIRIAPLADSALVARRLGDVRRVVCASPAYLQRHEAPKQPKDLVKHRCLRNTGSDVADWRFRDAGKNVALRVKGPFQSTSSDVIIEAALQGVGLAWVLSYQVTEHLKSGKLKLLLASFELPPIPVSAVMSHGRALAPKIGHFVDHLADTLRKRGAFANFD